MIEDIQREMAELFECQDQMTSLEFLTKSNDLKRRYDYLVARRNEINLNNRFNNFYRAQYNYISDEYIEIRYIPILTTIPHLE